VDRDGDFADAAAEIDERVVREWVKRLDERLEVE